MKVKDYREQISVLGTDDVWNYGRTCRRLSTFCFVLMLLLLLLLQGMTFFVALSAGYNRQLAMQCALVPVAGPLYCGGLLALAKNETAAILFLLFAPWLLTLICGVRYRGEYRRIRKAVNTPELSNQKDGEPGALSWEEFDATPIQSAVPTAKAERTPIKPVESVGPIVVPQPPAASAPATAGASAVIAPPAAASPAAASPAAASPAGPMGGREQETPRPLQPAFHPAEFEPLTSTTAAPQPQPINRAVELPKPPINHAAEPQSPIYGVEIKPAAYYTAEPQPSIYRPAVPQPMETASAPAEPAKPERPAASPLETAEKEYRQALEDVLSILNKNK